VLRALPLTLLSAVGTACINSYMETVRFLTYLFSSRAATGLAPMALAIGWNIGCGGSVDAVSADAGHEPMIDASQSTLGGVDASRASDAGATPDGPSGTACSIDPSNYDESCSSDSDCVNMAGNIPVDFGNYCQFLCRCGGDAINRTSVGQFMTDVLNTPLGSGAFLGMGCGCGYSGPSCCREGRCAVGATCEPGDGSTAAADTGAE
jgi:hypothetical protein